MISIREQVDLKPFNTFGIAANARYFVTITSTDELRELMTTDIFKTTPHLIIGGGSNLLLTRDADCLVIQVAIKGIEPVHEDDTTVTVRAGAGEVWHDFVMHCVARNWGGVENLSLIPGTVGAAPMQNIGAYGVEVREVINTVEGIDLSTGELRTFSNEQCEFGYRESIFKHAMKGKIFISSITLTLTKKNHNFTTSYGAIQETLQHMGVTFPTIQTISEAVIRIRSQKLPDPRLLGNAGSFFKNPTIAEEQYETLKSEYASMPGYKTENQEVKIPAAWLIEQCGWKGKRVGRAGVHAFQPLVLVNADNATGEEIWSLAMNIQASVKEKFGVTLQPEVNVF